jgi:hypothetical protein
MARTVIVTPSRSEDAKMPNQMKIYGIKTHGVWGFEVPDPDPHKPAHIFEFKRNVRKSWHAALAYAREHHAAQAEPHHAMEAAHV